jgi:hypothetical protein
VLRCSCERSIPDPEFLIDYIAFDDATSTGGDLRMIVEIGRGLADKFLMHDHSPSIR